MPSAVWPKLVSHSNLQAIGALLLLMAASLAGCASDPTVELPEPQRIQAPWNPLDTSGGPWNVLLITLDTTRQDHFGCYGFERDITPNLDRLASEGILFAHATTPIPVTLPSHATILTGLDPCEHGVRNNGAFVLDDRFETVAEFLQTQGYHTGATPAAIPLAGRFGLAQGFDTYDDDFPKPATQYDAGERRAGEVTDIVLDWIRAAAAPDEPRPFFHWAHYFDPHHPYDPPEPFLSRAQSPYEGEIAYTDNEIGRLIQALGDLGLRRNTWIVVVADHGEALGQHNEAFHTMLLYRPTLDVPMLVIPPTDWHGLGSSSVRGVRIEGLVRLKDVAPTLIHGLGFAENQTVGTGCSLLPMVGGTWEGPLVAYQETLVPYLEYGWCELRGVRLKDWTYIRAPKRELYDLQADPGELENLHEERAALAATLDKWIDFFVGDEIQASPQAIDQETVEQLRSLGYVGSATPSGSPVNDRDPKELMPLFHDIANARTSLKNQNPGLARQLLENVLRQDPGNPEANRIYGSVMVMVGEPERAIGAYAKLREHYPQDPQIPVDMAYACLQAGRFPEAVDYLQEALVVDPSSQAAINLMPRALGQSGDIEGGRRFLQDRLALAENPSAAEALKVLLMQYEWEVEQPTAAVRLAEEILEANPGSAAAHTILGNQAWETGIREQTAAGSSASLSDSAEIQAAQRHWQAALESDPNEAVAAMRLGSLFSSRGQLEEAIEMYRHLIEFQPDNGMAHAELGKLLHRANRGREAIQHYQQAYAYGYYEAGYLTNLGIAMSALGDRTQARVLLRKALQTDPSPQLAAIIQRHLASMPG